MYATCGGLLDARGSGIGHSALHWAAAKGYSRYHYIFLDLFLGALCLFVRAAASSGCFRLVLPLTAGMHARQHHCMLLLLMDGWIVFRLFIHVIDFNQW